MEARQRPYQWGRTTGRNGSQDRGKVIHEDVSEDKAKGLMSSRGFVLTSAAGRVQGMEVPLAYVALGDSYTIGTSVGAAERWPKQLVVRLGGALQLVANLGVNGYTSRDVVEDVLPRLDRLAPEFASILVGVNDVVQGVPAERFRRDSMTILDALIARLPASRILSVSTPDYTVTPRGGSFGDPVQQRAGIVRNNTILRELAEARGIAFVDIFDVSSRAARDRSLVARDGLHPSGVQYTLWVDRIEPVVRELLDREPSPDGEAASG